MDWTDWLVHPKSFPFENMYRFIKSYDFKGSLIEHYTTEPKQGPCLMKLKLVLDKKKRMLHISFHYLSVKEKWEQFLLRYTYGKEIFNFRYEVVCFLSISKAQALIAQIEHAYSTLDSAWSGMGRDAAEDVFPCK